MFTFYEPGPLIDNDLELRLDATIPADLRKGFVSVYQFQMVHRPSAEPVGTIQLRVGTTAAIRSYAGHLGYGVLPRHRGHHYAARGCRLLIPLARKHQLNPLWITCNPDNIASRRTCELAGAYLVEIVDVPAESEMFRKGERQKCRYRLDL
jgi:predicted acetyltransferase